MHCEGSPELLFTGNDTNTERLYGVANRTPYVKDGINNYIVHGTKEAARGMRRLHRRLELEAADRVPVLARNNNASASSINAASQLAGSCSANGT